MTESVIIGNVGTCILTAVALLLLFTAFVVNNGSVSACLHITSFLCVLGCITYALLLGAELDEVLVYVLVFTLLGMTVFLPKPSGKPNAQKKITETTPEEQNILPEPETVSDEGGEREL